MHLNTDFLSRWEEIIDQVDKDHVPIDVVRKVVFKTTERRQKTINIGQLRKQGFDEESIMVAIESFIRDNEDIIANMEFVLDIEAVAEILQPETDKLLRGI